MAKAMAESANVTRKLGEIDAHEKNLTLMETFRHVFGEDGSCAGIVFFHEKPNVFCR